MNKVILMGRLVRDPEIRYTGGEDSVAVANYVLAVPRKRKAEENAASDFFHCKAFGKGAEFAEEYLRKGIKVLVTGRIQLGSYTNKEGRKVNTTDILVDDQEFAESKKAFEELIAATGRPAYEGDFSEVAEGNEEDLPFK